MTGTSADGASGATVRRAAAFVDAGQPREALAVLASAEHDSAGTAAARRVGALALLALDEVDDACAEARRAVALEPDDSTGLIILSTALSRAGDHHGAVEAARRAVAAAPGSWRAHVAVADVLFLDPARRAEALRASFEAVRLGPEEPAVHRRHGDVLLAAGRHRDAQAAYRRGLALAPAAAGTQHNLAVSRLRRGHDGEAAVAFAGVLADDPADATARRNFVIAVVNPFVRSRVILGLTAVMTGPVLAASRTSGDTGRFATTFLPGIGIVAVVLIAVRFGAETRPRTRSIVATARRAVPGWTALAAVTGAALLVSIASVFLPSVPALVAQGVVFLGVVVGSVQIRRILSAFPRTRPTPAAVEESTGDESAGWGNPA